MHQYISNGNLVSKLEWEGTVKLVDTPSQSFLFFASGQDFTFAVKGTASYCCWEVYSMLGIHY